MNLDSSTWSYGGYWWRIGNGVNVSLWFNAWLSKEPLCLMVEEIDLDEILWIVSDIINSEGVWIL